MPETYSSTTVLRVLQSPEYSTCTTVQICGEQALTQLYRILYCTRLQYFVGRASQD
jgi:hypothetical protein